MAAITDDPTVFDLDPRERVCEKAGCRLVHWTPTGQEACDR